MPPETMKFIVVVSMIVGFVVGLAIQAVVCWLLSSWLSRVPREHRRQEPGRVWLLMIPLFAAVWTFFVYPRICDSFDSYFRSVGQEKSTGRGLAMTYCVLTAVMVPVSVLQIAMNPVFRDEPIPQGVDPLSMGTSCIALVGLVLWVLLLVKFYGLKKNIPEVQA